MKKYIKSSKESGYPKVTLRFNYDDGNSQHMVAGELGSAEFIHDLIYEMRYDDDFAKAMADMIDPGLNNQIWEDTTYENIAIDAVDLFKDNYDEWKSLKSRGREDSDFWVFISDDESIEVLS